MIQRCYSNTTKADSPAYTDCSIVEEWKYFKTFRAWMITQDWKGNELDKDLLVKGNKVYGPAFCIFIPQSVNLFVKPNTKSGISYVSKRPRLVIRNPRTGKTDYLGTFNTVEEAMLVRNKYKHELALLLAETVKDSRVAKALRTYYLEDTTNE